MTDNSGAQRPTGKRQRTGAAETSTDAYQNKRVVRGEAGEGDSKPGGGVATFVPEVVTEMKKVVCGTPEPFLMPAAFSSSLAAGGDFRMKSNERSS